MAAFTTNTATTPIKPSAFIARITTRIADITGAITARRAAVKGLRGLDARHLRDVGLTESDVYNASVMPLGQDAADALHRASLGRSGNW